MKEDNDYFNLIQAERKACNVMEETEKYNKQIIEQLGSIIEVQRQVIIRETEAKLNQIIFDIEPFRVNLKEELKREEDKI